MSGCETVVSLSAQLTCQYNCLRYLDVYRLANGWGSTSGRTSESKVGVKREGRGDICIPNCYHTSSTGHAQDDHDDDAGMCSIVEASMGRVGGQASSSRLMPSRVKRARSKRQTHLTFLLCLETLFAEKVALSDKSRCLRLAMYQVGNLASWAMGNDGGI